MLTISSVSTCIKVVCTCTVAAPRSIPPQYNLKNKKNMYVYVMHGIDDSCALYNIKGWYIPSKINDLTNRYKYIYIIKKYLTH